MRTVLGVLALVLCASPALAEVSESQKAEIRAMKWGDGSNITLENSKSSVKLPGFDYLKGSEARRFRKIIDGQTVDNLEVDAFNGKTESELLFIWLSSGHVKMDDWADLDADALLAQIKANDAEANKQRTELGLPTLMTIGWKQKPTLNQDLHTVSWTIEGQDSTGQHIINAIALKLGRLGFERIVWIDDISKMDARNDLLVAVNNHSYDAGSRYDDYIASDHTAEFGIAGLVAGALGVKLLKVAGAGALLIFLKKFAFLLLLPLIFVWRWITGLFRRRET